MYPMEGGFQGFLDIQCVLLGCLLQQEGNQKGSLFESEGM